MGEVSRGERGGGGGDGQGGHFGGWWGVRGPGLLSRGAGRDHL